MTLSKRKELLHDDSSGSENGPKSQKAVKEVWRLLEYLMAAAPCPDDLWTAGVSHKDVLTILECLDTGDALPDAQDKQVARVLVVLLSSLPAALVGPKGGECEGAKDRDEAFAALDGLEQVNTNASILFSVLFIGDMARADDRY